MLYFFERPRQPSKHNERAALQTEEMFERYNLLDLPYLIKPTEVCNYEDQLQTNINVFSFFDDERKARIQCISEEKIIHAG